MSTPSQTLTASARPEAAQDKPRKYRYLLVIQGNYGCGWEDESEYDTALPDERKQARADLKEYRLAAPDYGHRLIRRREALTSEDSR